jgi:hypothetical protein
VNTDAARERARSLLLDYLTPGQRDAFLALGHFDVVKTGSRRSLGMLLFGYPRFRVYRLSVGRHPVTLFTTAGQLAISDPWCAFCVHAHCEVPMEDALLSMKLLIDHDEPLFLRIAQVMPFCR